MPLILMDKSSIIDTYMNMQFIFWNLDIKSKIFIE